MLWSPVRDETPGSLLIGLWQGLRIQRAIAVAQPYLPGDERLFNAIDQHRDRRRRQFQRIAVPDHDIGALSRLQAAKLARQSHHFGWLQGDRRQRFRSEARRVGTGIVSKGRSWWWP